MILIADSGSTKTHWAIVDKNKVEFKETEGLNPFYVNELIVSQAVQTLTTKQANKIYFYGAGCASEEKKDIIRNGLKNKYSEAEIYVESDILGAAKAVYADKPGWIAILGTGSNVSYYDGCNLVKHTPSLGYILGDEGSGTHLGKKLLTKVFYKQLDNNIIQDFYSQYDCKMYNILSEVYTKPFPNRYLAQFSKFIYKHKQNNEIQAIILESFYELFKQHILPYYTSNEPIAFVGSIAYYFQDELKTIAHKNQITLFKVTKTPIQGLLEYHCGFKTNKI